MAFPSYGFSSIGKSLATTDSMNSGNNNNNSRPRKLVNSNNEYTPQDSSNNISSNQVDNNVNIKSKNSNQSNENEQIRKGLDTSIISIESQHKEYTIYSPLKGLNNKELNNILDFELAINQFYETLVKNLSMHQIYHLTLRQLIDKDISNLKTDQDYFTIIKQIVNNKETLKENKLMDLKNLQNQAKATIKRVLVAYIIYQYMGYVGLQAIDAITHKFKKVITQTHSRKGAFKHCVNAEQLIQQSFAEFIGEKREIGHEIIKYHNYKTRIGESTYNNLNKKRTETRSSIKLFIKTPGELLNEKRYRNTKQENKDHAKGKKHIKQGNWTSEKNKTKQRNKVNKISQK